MLNTSVLIKNIKTIMEKHNLSASQFADKINVQRSSISHILSGRNKPSLDFVIKITNAFETVTLHWLLYGEQEPAKNKTAPTLSLSNLDTVETASKNTLSKGIKRVLIFYTDGTFEEFTAR